jgi:hypothetical protein
MIGLGTTDALREYESARDHEFDGYLHERARYYAAQTRFQTRFWIRRACADL